VTDKSFIKSIILKYSLPRDSRLLDIGCGTGWYSHLFHEQGFDAIAIDLSKTGLQKGLKHYNSDIGFIQCDAFNLPFKTKFDIIFCFWPFIYVKEFSHMKYIFRYFLDYLKIGGIFIFMVHSDLSGNISADGITFNYKLNQIRAIFEELEEGKIIGDIYATNRQLFPFFGKYALSRSATHFTSNALRIHKKNIRIVAAFLKN
jgi:SAM-dependent methyltransferase